MAVSVQMPALGESVTEATVGKWFKKAGDTVKVEVEGLGAIETTIAQEVAQTRIG